MKVSILNWQALYWVDYSKKWAEVFDISEQDFAKIQSKTHELDIESKQLVELPQPEPTPIPEPTEEEIKEAKLQEIEKALIRKQALVELGEDTAEVELKLADIKRETPVVIESEKA